VPYLNQNIMVNTPSIAAAQANDSESKRRKQTLERARANHLSRQLQMRLQYARLKVDHGWQKQSLNEVENLYFHHSHMRGPRPYPSSSALTTFAQPSLLQPSNTTRPNATQSSLSFKQHVTGSSRPAIEAENLNGGTVETSKPTDGRLDEMTGTKSHDIQAAHLPSNNSPPLINPTLLSPEDYMHVDPTLKSAERMPSPIDDPFIATSNTTLVATAPAPAVKPKSKSSSKSKLKTGRSPNSPSQGVPMLTNNNNSLSHSTSSNVNNNSQSNSNHNTASYEFGNSTLTYDSFWSSHSTSASAPASKSYRNVFGVGIGAGEAEMDRLSGGGLTN